MKQALKKVLVLFCMISISICGAEKSFAYTPPNIVLLRYQEYDIATNKAFGFQPEYSIYGPNGTVVLYDTTSEDNKIHVPAGKEFFCTVLLSEDYEPGYYQIMIFGNSGLVHKGEVTKDPFYQVYFPPVSEEEAYTVFVIAYSNEVILKEYWFDIWQL